MTQIGNFTKISDGSYVGEIVTLWVQAKNVRIEALDSGQIENGFTHRVTVGRAEIGGARSNLSDSGQDCLALTLDDPSFEAPIFAILIDNPDGATAKLIWTRSLRHD